MTPSPKRNRPHRRLSSLAPRLVLCLGPCGTDMVSATLAEVDGAFGVARLRAARKGRQP